MKYALMTTALVVIGTAASAQQTLSVVGSWSNLPLHKEYEVPYWTEGLAAATGGAVTANLTTHDQMGINGGDVFRMMSDGVFNVGMTASDYAVSDSAALEGLDVPLLAEDADGAYAIMMGARPMMDEIYRDVFDAHVLGVAPYPPQVVFCNAEINGLSDLAGLKVRASGRMTANVLEALGAESVTMAFGEVPGALQRGVVDCGVTGAGSGLSAGWWEVSTHLLPLALGGWDPVVAAIRLDTWNSFDAATQEAIQTSFTQQVEEPAWAATQAQIESDVACLTGGDCPTGEAHDMTLVAVTEADSALVRELLINDVLPAWAERAGGDWGQRWNETVGRVAGIEISLN